MLKQKINFFIDLDLFPSFVNDYLVPLFCSYSFCLFVVCFFSSVILFIVQ